MPSSIRTAGSSPPLLGKMGVDCNGLLGAGQRNFRPAEGQREP